MRSSLEDGRLSDSESIIPARLYRNIFGMLTGLIGAGWGLAIAGLMGRGVAFDGVAARTGSGLGE